MNSFAYHLQYLKNGCKHNQALLNKMYPLPIINKNGKLNYGIVETPFYQDTQGIGWDRYMKQKEASMSAKKWKKLTTIS